MASRCVRRSWLPHTWTALFLVEYHALLLCSFYECGQVSVMLNFRWSIYKCAVSKTGDAIEAFECCVELLLKHVLWHNKAKWETFEAISAKWCAEGCKVGALFVEWYVPVPLLCVNNGEEFSSLELAYHLINCLWTIMFLLVHFLRSQGSKQTLNLVTSPLSFFVSLNTISPWARAQNLRFRHHFEDYMSYSFSRRSMFKDTKKHWWMCLRCSLKRKWMCF